MIVAQRMLIPSFCSFLPVLLRQRWRSCWRILLAALPGRRGNVRILRIFHIGRHSQLISQPCPPIQPWAHQTRSGIQTAAREQDSIGGYCCCPADPPTLSPRSSPPLRILCCRLRYHSSRVSLPGTLTSADRLRILIAGVVSIQPNQFRVNSRTPSRFLVDQNKIRPTT